MKSVQVDLFDAAGGPRTLNCKVTRIDEANDLALLEAPEVLTHQAVLGLGAAHSMPIGQPLLAVGAAQGHTPYTATSGFLAAKSSELRSGAYLWQGSFMSWFGNSGGAIFDARSGFLVGLLTRGDAPNCSYFVPVDTIAGFLEDASRE